MSNKYSIESYLENKTPISSFRLKNKLFQYGIKEKFCEGCNRDKWGDFPIPLELHHIDGNPQNNNIINLQVLCPNCHSLTTNYKGANKKTNNFTIEETIELIKNSTSINQVILALGYTSQGSYYANIRAFMVKYGVSLRDKTEEELLEEKQNRKHLAKEREHLRKLARGNVVREQSWIDSRKALRPSKEELLQKVWNISVSKIAKELEVSDNAVRKWAKTYNIPVPPVGWWAKWNNGHYEECLKIKEQMFMDYKVGAEGLEPSSLRDEA